MTKTIEYYFDFVSAASFFSSHVLPKIAKAAGAELIYKPFFLGGVMKATENRPPALVIPKGIWMGKDLARFAKKYDVTYVLNPNFPVLTLTAMRGALALQGTENFQPYVMAMTNAMWQEQKNLADPEVLGEIVASIGIDPDEFAAMASASEVKQKLKDNTEEAVARGAFGAPTMFVGDDMYFGQDRLFMVAEAVGVDIRDVCPNY